MIKDDADAILDQAKRLMEEDVSCETRIRVARKIIASARAIKVMCMAEPAIKYGGNRQTITVNVPPIAAPTTTQKQIAAQIAASAQGALHHTPAKPAYASGGIVSDGPVMVDPVNPDWFSEPKTVIRFDGKETHVWGSCRVNGVVVSDGLTLPHIPKNYG